MVSSTGVLPRTTDHCMEKTPRGSLLVKELETEGFVGAVEWERVCGGSNVTDPGGVHA